MYIINEIKIKIKQIIGEESLEFFSHAKNYMTAQFFTKAIVFFSIPVFTRLMTPDEYGMISIFTSIIAVATIIMGLNFNGSIVRYYHEDENNFGEFISSNILFLFIFNIVFLIILNHFKNEIASLIEIDLNVFIIAIIVSIFNIPVKIFLSYLQTSKQSKKYSVISASRSLTMIFISVLWVYLLTDKRYLGRMYGQLVVYSLLFIISIFYFIKLGKPKFKLKYIKYSLLYGIPLIPHALSHFILSSFDRIAINQINGSFDTGLYSFAYNVGLIMNVVVIAMNKAWVPIFYDNLKKNNYNRINKIVIKYSKYIFFAAIILVLYSKEIVIIFADEKYYNSLNLVPIIILSYVFVYFYTLFANYSFYRKRTGIISIATLFAGAINVYLNYLFIPRYGYFAAAYTTLFSYMLLFLFHYFNVKFIIKEKIINLKEILYWFLIMMFMILFYFILANYITNYYWLFTLKIILSFINLIILIK